ncbi:hypothetical protein [Methanosarcina mazei]|uniref:hypothetical protein n=1 Tax=Methanosarcina mazei TaxID=2209 RepID=UPI000A5BABD3|nr:hypothetical protein [Methanosarcina mazei]
MLDRIEIQQKGMDVIWMKKNKTEIVRGHVLKFTVGCTTPVEYPLRKQRIIG